MNKKLVLASVFAALAPVASPALAQLDTPVRNVVLVHGALMDGSGWRAVHDILVDDGYTVRVVQLPLTSLEEDIAATRRVLAGMDGPVILVGHSYGGVVITVAGDDPDVSGLVYVAALQPDVGESLNELNALAAPPPSLEQGAVIVSEDGFIIVNPDRFHDVLAADLPTEGTNFLAASQAFTAGATFAAEVATAAWHNKPSYGVVATQDRTVNPDLQRLMYERSNSTITEVESSHLVFLSQPQAVADVIEAAADGAE